MLKAAWYRFRVQRTPWNQTERAAVSLGKGQFLFDKRDARGVEKSTLLSGRQIRLHLRLERRWQEGPRDDSVYVTADKPQSLLNPNPIQTMQFLRSKCEKFVKSCCEGGLGQNLMWERQWDISVGGR